MIEDTSTRLHKLKYSTKESYDTDDICNRIVELCVILEDEYAQQSELNSLLTYSVREICKHLKQKETEAVMPLVKGKKASTRKGFSENIRREMHEGKPQKQAVAIAYSEARRGKKKAK